MFDIEGFLVDKFDMISATVKAIIPPLPVPPEDRVYVVISDRLPSIKDLFNPEKQPKLSELLSPTDKDSNEEEFDDELFFFDEDDYEEEDFSFWGGRSSWRIATERNPAQWVPGGILPLFSRRWSNTR